MLTKTMRKQVQYLSVGEVKIFIRLDLTLLPSLYLDESNGGCRQIILNDFLMENEVREKQLLGVNLGKLLVIVAIVTMMLSAVTDSAILHTCAPRRQHQMTKHWSSGDKNYMAMQGKCWTLDLSSPTAAQSHDNYLTGSKEFINDKNCPNGTACPWGSLYGSLGMSVHATGNEILYGAPGAYTWKGTFAAKK